MPEVRPRVGFAFATVTVVVVLLLAGVVSSFAANTPDGLDAVTRQGCVSVETERGEQFRGSCVARDATPHSLGSGPLADYTVNGAIGTTGVAGVVGVLASFGLMWVLLRAVRAAGARRRIGS